jgi:hypothetical protein
VEQGCAWASAIRGTMPARKSALGQPSAAYGPGLARLLGIGAVDEEVACSSQEAGFDSTPGAFSCGFKGPR